MPEQIRKPVQKRSIETKKKIIDAGYALFSEVGYFNTNTAEIAKRAGVSTGIVYGYFKDKRDIMIDVLDVYLNSVYQPILLLFDDIDACELDEIVPRILKAAIKAHHDNANIHEALHALTHSDSEVARKFVEVENDITLSLVEKMSDKYPVDNLTERVHLAMNIVQSLAHEYVFDHHSYIDYDVMFNLVKNILFDLFGKNNSDNR
ncbi:MAG: TetR/AcrR family transcriptional regulator [Christensenellales bacterium]